MNPLTPIQESDIQIMLSIQLNDPIHRRDDVRQQAILEILQGKPLGKALRHARAAVAIQLRPSAWFSLDFEDESFHSNHEQVALVEKEDMEKWRVASLSSSDESLLLLLNMGTAAIASMQIVGQKQLSQRRIQQKIKELISKSSINRGLWDEEGGEVI